MLYSFVGMPPVFVVSRDWDLRGAVRAELRHAGVDARGMETVDDLGVAIAAGTVPSVVVVDGAELQNPVARAALENIAGQVAVLVVDSSVSPAPPLPGSQLMQRPVQVKEIVGRVLAMLRGGAA
jgi:hypothetical protein